MYEFPGGSRADHRAGTSGGGHAGLAEALASSGLCWGERRESVLLASVLGLRHSSAFGQEVGGHSGLFPLVGLAVHCG